MAPFLVAVFLSAFLLFQVQPIIARVILPVYGGSPAVWTSCMMFFQLALLLGYFYAHLLATRLTVRSQVVLHLALLTIALILLPTAKAGIWLPAASDQQAMDIFRLLLVSVGVPFTLISASGPLLQHWFAGTYSGKSPFRLYAVSNLGSLMALISYPLFFEPLFTLDTQLVIWSISYLALVPFFVICGIVFFRHAQPQAAVPRRAAELSAVTLFDRILWVALAACGSVLLLATTNQLSQNIAVIPFLWVMPLSIYLITMIICFDRDAWYQRDVAFIMLAAALALVVRTLFAEAGDAWNSVGNQLSTYAFALLACCMVCHGELARSRPAAAHLTTFYLYVALGGALGGVFVNLIAPLIFRGFWELHSALAGTVVLAAICLGRDRDIYKSKRQRALVMGTCALLTAVLSYTLLVEIKRDRDNAIAVSRGFFGVLQVKEWQPGSAKHARGLYHGAIQHGLQFMSPSKEYLATGYYGTDSGAGLAIRNHPRRMARNADERGLHIGVVGLGIGTVSTHAVNQDRLRYYEINEQVEYMAREYFSYLENGPADTRIILGDARISLQQELSEFGGNQFDVLILDAFSGDAIPVHLLTEEAFALYAQHLRPDGILAIHITNLYLDLAPVGLSAAATIGADVARVEGDKERWYEHYNDWLLISRNSDFMNAELLLQLQSDLREDPYAPVRWTDDFSNLLQVVK